MVRAMLDAGADPTFVVRRVRCPETGDTFDVTPLWAACSWAPPNGGDMRHIELPPAKPRRTACGRLLLERIHVDHKSGPHGRTQLHGACIIGKTDVVRGLLLLGADINLADATGKTPLDYAPVPSAGPRDADQQRGARVSPRRPPPGLLEAPLRSDFRARPRTRRRRRRVPRAPLGVVPRRRRPPQVITKGLHTTRART